MHRQRRQTMVTRPQYTRSSSPSHHNFDVAGDAILCKSQATCRSAIFPSCLISCRYRWHMEDVRSWLLAPGKRSIKACSMPANDKDNPTSRRLLQSPPGKSQRLQLAGHYISTWSAYLHDLTQVPGFTLSCLSRSILRQAHHNLTPA